MSFALYLLALAVFVMGTSEFMLAGLLPAISADLDVDLGAAGLLTSAFAVGMALGAPLMAAAGPRSQTPRTPRTPSPQNPPGPAPNLGTELAQLLRPQLAGTMLLAALVNGGTFAAFTFIAPIVTVTAGVPEGAVPLVLVLFGLGSFSGITIAGRFSDRRPLLILIVGGPLLLAGWIALNALAEHPAALLALVFAQGFLSFAVGSTLITRVLYAATGAPRMGGSYATMALNVGAALGPVLGGITLSAGSGQLSPVWVAMLLVALALLIALAAPRLLGSR